MRRSIRSMEYVQGDRHAAAEPASDGFADFGSLDGLEAAIGRAEQAAARSDQTRVWGLVVGREFLPAASAPGRRLALGRTNALSASAGPELDSNRRSEASLQGVLAHSSGCGDAARLAELAKVQQRQARALEKITELVQRRREKTMDAAGNQPFEFGP